MSDLAPMSDLFLRLEKQPEVFFHTSNTAKYLHARVVFEHQHMPLQHFKGHTEPYHEEYAFGKKELLSQAIRQILEEIGGRSSIFFVEDTSLRIEALSEEEKDYPGLSVKEWFNETDFESLDFELRKRGGTREATVKSDVALHLPGLEVPVFFYGETRGTIALSPPDFAESIQYPWLTPNSFNGWFIPDGADKRLGEMTLEESWKYDFRTKALLALLGRLEEYAIVLNLPPRAYTRPKSFINVAGQLSLFEAEGEKLIVIGRTCCGKTTFGEYAQRQYTLPFIEASSIMKGLASEYAIQEPRPFERSKKVLETRGYDVVARIILQKHKNQLNNGFVISGFRTIEELEVMKTQVPGVKVILIDSDERMRYERYIRRRRDTYATSFSEFIALDEQQGMLGLLLRAGDFADIRIRNEASLEDYSKQIDAIVTGIGKKDVAGLTTELLPRAEQDRSQLYRCLIALDEAGRPLTCDEIEAATGRHGRPIRFNNVNKVLKVAAELVQRYELDNAKLRYEIKNPGRAYVRLMRKRLTASKSQVDQGQ